MMLLFLFLYVNTAVDLICTLIMCICVYRLISNFENEYNGKTLIITVSLMFVFMFRNFFFDYSFINTLKIGNRLLKYLLMLCIVFGSFPALNRTVNWICNLYDDFLFSGRINEYYKKLFTFLLGYRVIARTVVKYIFNFEILKSIDSFLLIYMTVCGLIYIINYAQKKKFNSFYYVILIILAALYISVFYNAFFVDLEYLYENRTMLLNIAFCVFILYPLGEWLSLNGKIKSIADFVRPIFYLWSASLVIVLIKVYYQLDIPVLSSIYFNVSLFMNEHYNIVARQIATFMFAGMLLLSYDKSKKNLLLDCLFIIVNYFALILCNSRGAYLAGLLCMPISAGFILYDRTKKTVLGVGTAIAVFVLYSISKELPFIIYQAITINEPMLLLNSSISSFDGKQLIGIYHRNSEGFRGFDQDGADTLNGRLYIWKYCIAGFLSDIKVFLFGVTRSGTGAFLYKVSEGVRADMNTHNMFIEVACASGIFAFIPYVIYVFKTGVDCLKTILSKQQVQLKIMGCFIFFVFISYMIEESFIYEDTICTFAFFVCSAIIINSTGIRREHKHE